MMMDMARLEGGVSSLIILGKFLAPMQRASAFMVLVTTQKRV